MPSTDINVRNCHTIYALLEDVFETEANKVVEANDIHESWQEGLIQSTEFALQNLPNCRLSDAEFCKIGSSRSLLGLAVLFFYASLKNGFHTDFLWLQATFFIKF